MNKTYQLYLANEADMLAVGARLSRAIPHTSNNIVIFLEGPLGAGKTTLTRGFLQNLGYTAKVKSPTYTLVEPYELNHLTVFHFDFYRLTSSQELAYIGIQDYFSPHTLCLIEWPEKGFPLLPKPDLICELSMNKIGRDIRVVAQSNLGEEMVRSLINDAAN